MSSPEDMFPGLMAASPYAVLTADPDGTIVWTNAAAETMFARPAAELVGAPLTLIATEWQPDGESVGPRAAEGVRGDGTTCELSIVTVTRRDDAGQVLGIGVIARDVTERSRVQHDLTEALARSTARFDQSGTPQALLDLDARIKAINDAACELLRSPRELLIGRSAVDLIIPVDPLVAEERFRRLRCGDITTTTAEVVAMRGDGGQVPLFIDLSVVSDDDGFPREVALFAHDLTAIREAHRQLEAQDTFFRALHRRASDIVIVTDDHARIRYVSPSITRLLGYRRDELIGAIVRDFLHDDDIEASLRNQQQLMQMPAGESVRRLMRMRDADGDLHWLDSLATNCLQDPDIAGMVTNLRDVTAEIEAQNALRNSESRFRAIAETAQEGILALAPDGSVLFANEKMASILGIRIEELYENGISDLLDSDEAGRMDRRLADRDRVGSEHYEVSYTDPRGDQRTLFVAASPLLNDDGSAMGSLGMVSDVTHARDTEAELRHRALHDTLTGLPNRALLVDRLTMASARMSRDGGRGLAVLFLDLDHFKLVNDSRGHDAGDQLLTDVAARLLDAVRDVDTVARLGGDEFAIVCDDADQAQAEIVATRIQKALATPFILEGEPVYISASVGIALSPPHAVTDLLRFADSAMYDAKAAGRSHVTTFAGTETVGSQRRLAITGALREALADGSLTLGYQPIVDFDRRRVLGFEALLRWQHPTLGMVPPLEVVNAADASGLSFELDRAVIHAAGDDLLLLRQRGIVSDEVFVSVNVSPRSIQQRRLDVLVDEMLARTGLPPSCLSLEITEHAIMDNAEHAVVLLGKLSELGVDVAIDDFGTGYNSLVHLQRLPVDVLKIDRSFVQHIASRSDSLAIARSIIGLATAIGLDTVAEGVETEAQVAILRELGCRVGQGFLWGQAVLVDEVPGSLARCDMAAAPGPRTRPGPLRPTSRG